MLYREVSAMQATNRVWPNSMIECRSRVQARSQLLFLLSPLLSSCEASSNCLHTRILQCVFKLYNLGMKFQLILLKFATPYLSHTSLDATIFSHACSLQDHSYQSSSSQLTSQLPFSSTLLPHACRS